jgi:50S ribosomal protein L16 3-hydroxylase
MSGKWEIGVDPDEFLSEYWQRKPLLIPNKSNAFTPPLSSDELAGLALEDNVESRLVEQKNGLWKLFHGPFEEADFARSHPWTLLVQAVDHYVPEVAELQRLFDFIPRWRMDDVMVSYATDGGSVGPHYDNYDVFLLQGEGSRLWRIGQRCDSTTPRLPHEDLRILQTFAASEEYLLGPGDILYLPPGIAHWGIAQGECTTFSIGFRAPTVSDMLARWTDQLLLKMSSDDFFKDAGRAPSARPGEIDSKDIDQALAQLHTAIDRAAGNDWFGELVTEPRYDIEFDHDELAKAHTLLAGGAKAIALSPAAKLSWTISGPNVIAFANGLSLHCAQSVLPSLLVLCGGEALIGTNLDKALAEPDTYQMLEHLLQAGCIHVR